MSRSLGISRSGYHAWRDRPPSLRSHADAALAEPIKAAHAGSRATCGAPRIHAELIDDGIQLGRKRIERLMKAAGIACVSRRKAARTTFRDDRIRPACDLVDRNFYADEPNQLWVADNTYVPTWAGFLYLAVVLDAFSRRIVGWAMGHNLKAQLVLDAMNMAIAQRKPCEVIQHCDQGSQYTSVAFGLRCKEAGVRPSMGSVGDAYDNAFVVRASSPPSNASCPTVASSRPRPGPEWPSSVSLRVGTIPGVVIPHSVISHQSITKGEPVNG